VQPPAMIRKPWTPPAWLPSSSINGVPV
jgi:hypothetical protein